MPASQQVKTHIDRFQDDESHWWIWLRDAAQLYDIPPQTLNVWKTRICPWTGRKLHPPRYEKVKVACALRKRCYLLESEVKEISAAMCRNCKPALSRAGDDAPIAEIQKKFPRATWRRLRYAHAHPERTPGSKGLWLDKLPARDKAGDVRMILHARPAEVGELLRHDSPNRSPVDSYTDKAGRVWYPPALASSLHGIRRALLGVIRRSKRKHPALGRTISYLRPSEVPTTVRGNKKVHYYLADDCKRIEEWQRRTTPLQKAKEFLRSLLVNGPVARPEVMRHARQAGISHDTLHRAREALPIKTSRVGFQGCSYWHTSQDKRPAAQAVSLPHPKLDKALQILRSFPDYEAAPLDEIAEQADVGRTTLWHARDMLRRGATAEPPNGQVEKAGTAIPSPDSTKKSKRGPGKKRETQDIEHYCWNECKMDPRRKNSTIAASVRRMFGRDKFGKSMVSIYAARHNAEECPACKKR